MKLLFVNCCTSDATFQKQFITFNVKPEASIQNYFQLLYKGLKEVGCEILTLCERQISTAEKGLYIKGEHDADSLGNYYYVPKLLIPGIGHLFSFIVNFFIAVRIILTYNPDVIVCDVMRYYISTPVKFAARIFGKTCVGYAADLPQMYNHQSSINQNKLLHILKQLYSKQASTYDAYIILSRYMNELINPNQRPYIVIEGIVDDIKLCTASMERVARHTANKMVIMYAGGLYKKYGIKMLIDAVIQSTLDIELWLFGKGDQEKYIEEHNSEKIKFFGYQKRDFVVMKQREADFLINPRFTHEDYTKYSFPSKIMEYMASGIPVISTRIKGIPNEYFDYIIPIDDETISGLDNTFKTCYGMTLEDKQQLGIGASNFVCKNKNYKSQGERLRNWFNNII